MDKIQVSKSCHVCTIRSVQEKMEAVILSYPQLQLEEEEKILSSYLTLLKSKSDQMLSFMQVFIKIKNDLSVALVDLERSNRTLENNEENQNRVVWLQERLKRVSSHCDEFFTAAELDINKKFSAVLETVLSPEVVKVLKASSKSGIFKKCMCETETKTNEEVGLHNIKRNVANILRYSENIEYIPKREPSLSPLLSKQKKKLLPNIPDVQFDLVEDVNERDDYWHSDHHRHEWFNYQQTINPLSWHALSTSHCDSFIKKEKISPLSTLPWIEKPRPDTLLDYNKIALDRLVDRLQDLYFSIEDAAIATTENSTTSFHNQKKFNRKKSISRKSLPTLSMSSSSIIRADTSHSRKSLAVKDCTIFDENSNQNSQQKNKSIFPRPPSVWCDELMQTSDLILNQNQQKKKMSKSGSSSLAESKKELSTPKSPTDKKTTIKRAAARVRAVAKIKRHFCAPKAAEDFLYEVKSERIQDLLGTNGLQSSNKNVVIDAAKCLGQLKFVDKDKIITGLKKVIENDKSNIAAYEGAKSLLLLGVWRSEAMDVITRNLKTGNKNIKKDLLSTIQQSPNAAFISKKSSSLMGLSHVLENLLDDVDNDLSLDAAMCLGHLCIYNENAKHLLLNRLDDGGSNYVVSKVLSTLIKQLNCKDDIVIDTLLKQIKSASSWKVRLHGIGLLRFIGLRRLQAYSIDHVFNVLQELLWNHPSQEFRHEVAELLKEFDLHEEACNNTLKQLLDKNELVRASAVIALSTLEMKGDRELKILLDMLDLDSSNYVRTQVIRAFKSLNWNSSRVIRALRERQKGDDTLAREATQALKILMV